MAAAGRDGDDLAAAVESTRGRAVALRDRAAGEVGRQQRLLREDFHQLRGLARVVRSAGSEETTRQGAAEERGESERLRVELGKQLDQGIFELLAARELLAADGVEPLHRLPSRAELRGERADLTVSARSSSRSAPERPAGDGDDRAAVGFARIFPVQDAEGWLVIAKGGSPPRPEAERPAEPAPVVVLAGEDEVVPVELFERALAAGGSVQEALEGYLSALAQRNGYLPRRVRDENDLRDLRQRERAAIQAVLAGRDLEHPPLEGVLARLCERVGELDWPCDNVDELRPLAFVLWAVLQAADGDDKALAFCHPRFRKTAPRDVRPVFEETIHEFEREVWESGRKTLLELLPSLPSTPFLHLFSASEILARRAGAGPLRDWTCGVKDVFCLGPTTAASAILEGFESRIEATAVARLRRAGCLFPGKTNLDEFALGSLNESSAFKPTPSCPAHGLRVAGGSSGGSAAAVAAGLVRFAIGSDTAGSIRVPASFCGVVGWKPSYGVIPRYGLLPLSMGLDVVGTLARNVHDTVRVASVLVGADPRDETTRGVEPIDFETEVEAAVDHPRTVGVPIEYFLNLDQSMAPLYEQFSAGGRLARLDPIEAFDELRALPARVQAELKQRSGSAVEREESSAAREARQSLDRLDKFSSIPGYWDRFRALLLRLDEIGWRWRLVSLPHTWLSIPTYFALSRAELASSLHRYDGITFGQRAPGVPYRELQSATRGEKLGFQPKIRILMGIHALRQKMARETLDADRRPRVECDFLDLSKRARRLIERDFESVFSSEIDVLLTPTTNVLAPPFGGSTDTVAEQRLDELTVPADLAGTAAIALPFGTLREVELPPERVVPEVTPPALPTSIQVIAPRFGDVELLAAARRLEGLIAAMEEAA